MVEFASIKDEEELTNKKEFFYMENKINRMEDEGVVADEDRLTHEQKKLGNQDELTHHEKKYVERAHGHGQKMHQKKLNKEHLAMIRSPRRGQGTNKGR